METPRAQRQTYNADDAAYNTYFDSIFEEGKTGAIKVTFEVRLDASFAEIIERLQENRLEHIEILVKDNDHSLAEQLNTLHEAVGKFL